MTTELYSVQSGAGGEKGVIRMRRSRKKGRILVFEGTRIRGQWVFPGSKGQVVLDVDLFNARRHFQESLRPLKEKMCLHSTPFNCRDELNISGTYT